ncbi:MAG TPA: hypothetical protein VKX49_28395 [Bryobacteraceae bacterium]|nr:hypothetical protein [Bryobacteraceae bacterium]
MRMYIVYAMMLCGLASAQAPTYLRQPFPTDNGPLTGEEWRLKLVERLMSFPSPVTNGAVQLWGMGDEAAVDVMKVLSTEPSPSSTEMQASLDLIHLAFEHPESIISPVNRKPRAALFVMKHFGAATDDPALKERIAQETARLTAMISADDKKPAAPQQ